jgi:hypothetical protein
MSDIHSERIRKEAADTVTSRPPAPSDTAADDAMRRYLGSALYQLSHHEDPEPGLHGEHRAEGGPEREGQQS